MIAVRYATLAALVLWLAAMLGARFGDLTRRAELVGYICGGAVLLGLLIAKLLGPPPRAFFARAGMAALMLVVAATASFTRSADAASVLAVVNIAIGSVLLTWYVRE